MELTAQRPQVLSAEQLSKIGAHLVMLVGTMSALGHESPAGSTVYTAPDGTEESLLVYHAFAACAGSDKEHRDWLDRFVQRHGLLDVIAEAVTR